MPYLFRTKRPPADHSKISIMPLRPLLLGLLLASSPVLPGQNPAHLAFTQLAWSDEFNGLGPLDSTRWFHQTQLPQGNSWFNGEIQHYTDRVQNSFQSKGTLKLIAQQETYTDQGVTKNYTSARLNSKFAFTYGRVVVRAKLPRGHGTWPAIWMLGKNIDENGAYWDQQGFGTTSWPACGEIDILEHWGSNQNYVSSATHTPSSFGATVNVGGQQVPTASSSFHIYTLEWWPHKLVFSVDGQVHYTYQPAVRNSRTWPFSSPQYLLLNIAIESSIAPSFVKDTLEVDYLRIYAAPDFSVVPSPPSAPSLQYNNPVQEALLVSGLRPNVVQAHYRIHDVQGRLLRQGKVSAAGAQLRIDGWAELPAGLYFVHIRTAGQHYQLKVRH